MTPTSSRSDNTALLAAAGATAIAAGAAAVFLARRDRAHTPRTPDIADTAPIPPLEPEPHREPHPTDPQLTADSAAAAPTDDPTEGSPADGPDSEGSDQPPAPATPQPTQPRPWLYIGTLHEQPVLIDPVATHGLGLTGPGAAAVARSLASGLLDMDDGDILIAATDTINALLEQPADYPVTPTDPADDVPSRPDEDERGHDQLRVTPDPFTALEALEAELAHRRTTPAPPAGWPLCVLLAPAPTTTPTQHRLAAALTAGQPFEIAAILIGGWPTGWNCHIDDDHRVTQHTHSEDLARPRSPQRDWADYRAPTAPAQIVGAQLSTSTPAELRQALTRAAPQPTDDGPDSRPQPQVPTPALDQSDPIGAASSEIREALDPDGRAEHASGDNARRRADPSTEPSPEPDQPDPAPQQLAERQPRDPAHPTSQHTSPQGASAPSGPGTVARPPLWLSIFGPTVLRYTPHLDPAAPSPGQVGEPGGTDVLIDRLGPRATELLVYLAVHPNGVGRDRLVAALWPDADRSRPTNALNAVLARLRKTLRATGDPDLAQAVIHVGGRYLLNSNLMGVDYWDFLIAAADITHPDPDHRAQACDTAIRTYQGHLAADLSSEWLITVREATRRRYFDALTTLARLTIHHEPERTLGLLETARNLEPLKEGIYRDIMRIQAQLHRPDAAENTLALLRAQLADIDAQPEPETLQLAATIRQHTSHHEASHHNGPDTATPTA